MIISNGNNLNKNFTMQPVLPELKFINLQCLKKGVEGTKLPAHYLYVKLPGTSSVI